MQCWQRQEKWTHMRSNKMKIYNIYDETLWILGSFVSKSCVGCEFLCYIKSLWQTIVHAIKCVLVFLLDAGFHYFFFQKCETKCSIDSHASSYQMLKKPPKIYFISNRDIHIVSSLKPWKRTPFIAGKRWVIGISSEEVSW